MPNFGVLIDLGDSQVPVGNTTVTHQVYKFNAYGPSVDPIINNVATLQDGQFHFVYVKEAYITSIDVSGSAVYLANYSFGNYHNLAITVAGSHNSFSNDGLFTGTLVNSDVVHNYNSRSNVGLGGYTQTAGTISSNNITNTGLFYNYSVFSGKLTNAGYFRNIGNMSAAIVGGGTIINQAGAINLGGGNFGTQDGTISGSISLSASGAFVQDDAGATISDGITLTGANSTIHMYGTFGRSLLLYGANDRLVLSQSIHQITFGVIRASNASILELTGSGDGSTAAGSLDLLAGSWNNFSTISIDANADWVGVSYYTFTKTIIDSGTFTNIGTISGNLSLAAGGTLINSGVVGGFGGAGNNGITNNSSGRIVSPWAGVVIGNATATVDNAGTIIGSAYAGVQLKAGGVVTNRAGGLIGGGYGVYIQNGLGTVVNAGTITADRPNGYTGVDLFNSGYVSNAASGVIQSQYGAGVVLQSTVAGTIINAGTITGGNGVAVALNSNGGRLIVDPGAVFNGVARGAGSSTLELASGPANGTLSGLGSSFTNFGSLVVDAGATWVLTGANVLASGTTLTNNGTLIAAGAITVGSGAAFNGSGASRLILDPGASVVGEVHGGGKLSTLELATGGAGTLAGLGSNYYGFGSVLVDSGANWTLTGLNKIAATLINDGVLAASSLTIAGTITNAGTISQVGTTALNLGDGGGGRLIVDPGAVFNGTVTGGGDTSVLELATGGAGTISGLGGSFTSFGAIAVDAGANWTLAGNNTVVNGTTLTNAGTLTEVGTLTADGKLVGSNGTALQLAGGASRLIVTSNGRFTGTVLGGGSSSVLELAGKGGTLSGLGTSFSGFGSVVVDSTKWTLASSNSLASGTTLTNNGTIVEAATATLTVGGPINGTGHITLGQTAVLNGSVASGQTIAFGGSGVLTLGDAAQFGAGITGFVSGDTIDVGGIGTAHSVGVSGNQVQLFASSNGTGTPLATFAALAGAAGAALTPGQFVLSGDGAGGTEVAALCFCAGTRIVTPGGEVAVEQLVAGDMVLNARGAARPIVWIGQGRVLATRGRRGPSTPVIVRKDALGDGVPHCDLRVTKGHSLWIDEVLIPVEFLVNHRSILWDDHAQEVSLYHIELATHDVLLANGAPAESYRDDGNRWLFQNENTGWDLPPQAPCAPVLTGGPVVDAAWRRLLDRAGPRPGLPLTDDPDLHLLADGRRMDAVSRHGGAHIFRLEVPKVVRIVSRASVPQELGVGRDSRLLGVALRRIVLRQGTRQRLIAATAPILADGFHLFESSNGLRWTDGDALVPAALFSGLLGWVELELHVDCCTRYSAEAAALAA